MQPEEHRSGRKAEGRVRMARYRVHVECSRTVPQTQSIYSQCAAYEVGGATEGIARAKAVEAAKAAKPEYDWFRVYHVEKLK